MVESDPSNYKVLPRARPLPAAKLSECRADLDERRRPTSRRALQPTSKRHWSWLIASPTFTSRWRCRLPRVRRRSPKIVQQERARKSCTTNPRGRPEKKAVLRSALPGIGHTRSAKAATSIRRSKPWSAAWIRLPRRANTPEHGLKTPDEVVDKTNLLWLLARCSGPSRRHRQTATADRGTQGRRRPAHVRGFSDRAL